MSKEPDQKSVEDDPNMPSSIKDRVEVKKDKKSNKLLRHARENRGWSQRRLAELIEADTSMVSRWECGDRKPNPFYQERLCVLFSKSAEELGFIEQQDRSKTAYAQYEHMPLDDAQQLAIALGASNADGWIIFNTSSTPGTLSTAQTQLNLLRQLHAYLPTQARPYLYSGVYRLIGATLFFQARYAEAMHAHYQSYLAALEAGDPWNMAESLGWQGGIWKACGQQEKAIQLTEAALRLISSGNDPHIVASRARMFAHWAESAALLHQSDIVNEKLATSAELLQQLGPNQEFDTSTWQQYQATCALYLGNVSIAVTYFEQALQSPHPHWLQRRAYTAQMLTQAYTRIGEPEQALATARIAHTLLNTLNSPLLSRGFIDDVQQLCTSFPDNLKIRAFTQEVQHQLAAHAYDTLPRYLEAKL